LGIVKTLPLNLLAALRALDASEVLKPALGAFPPAYIKLKTEEWNAYARHLTQWERDTTLIVEIGAGPVRFYCKTPLYLE
jgi:glutamine synthetase